MKATKRIKYITIEIEGKLKFAVVRSDTEAQLFSGEVIMMDRLVRQPRGYYLVS